MKLGFSKRSSWLPLLSLLILKRDLRNHRTYSQRLFIEELNANTGAHCHLTLSCCHCQHLDLCGLKACLRSWQSNILIENRVFLLLTWFDHFLIFAWQLEVPITKEKLLKFLLSTFCSFANRSSKVWSLQRWKVQVPQQAELCQFLLNKVARSPCEADIYANRPFEYCIKMNLIQLDFLLTTLFVLTIFFLGCTLYNLALEFDNVRTSKFCLYWKSVWRS